MECSINKFTISMLLFFICMPSQGMQMEQNRRTTINSPQRLSAQKSQQLSQQQHTRAQSKVHQAPKTQNTQKNPRELRLQIFNATSLSSNRAVIRDQLQLKDRLSGAEPLAQQAIHRLNNLLYDKEGKFIGITSLEKQAQASQIAASYIHQTSLNQQQFSQQWEEACINHPHMRKIKINADHGPEDVFKDKQEPIIHSVSFNENLAKIVKLCESGRRETAEAIAGLYEGLESEYNLLQAVLNEARSHQGSKPPQASSSAHKSEADQACQNPARHEKSVQPPTERNVYDDAMPPASPIISKIFHQKPLPFDTKGPESPAPQSNRKKSDLTQAEDEKIRGEIKIDLRDIRPSGFLENKTPSTNPSIGQGRIQVGFKVFIPGDTQAPFHLDSQKISTEILKTLTEHLEVSDKSCSDLIKEGLTPEEGYNFLCGNYHKLSSETLLQLANSVVIQSNSELSWRTNQAHISTAFKPDMQDSYFSLTQIFTSIENVIYIQPHVDLTDAGNQAVIKIAKQTHMTGQKSPFVQNRFIWGKVIQEVDTEKLSKLIGHEGLSPATAQGRAQLLRALNSEGRIEDVGLVATTEAFHARMELLQQADFYHHVEFRNLISTFPEYPAFICTLSEEIHNNLERFWHLKTVMCGNQDLVSYIHSEAARILENQYQKLAQEHNQYCQNLIPALETACERYLNLLTDTGQDETIKPIAQKLSDLKQALQAIQGNDGLSPDQKHQLLIDSLKNAQGNGLNFQDLIDSLNNPYLRNPTEFALHRTLQPLQLFNQLRNMWTRIKSTFGQYIRNPIQIDEVTITAAQSRLVSKEYGIPLEDLNATYIDKTQQRIHTELQISLLKMAPTLNKQEKELAGAMAQIALDANKAGDTATAGGLLNLFKPANFQEFCQGIIDEIKNVYLHDDLSISSLVHILAAKGHRFVKPCLPPQLQVPFLVYNIIDSAINTIRHSKTLVADARELLQAIADGRFRKAGGLTFRVIGDVCDLRASAQDLVEDGKAAFYFIRRNGSKSDESGHQERYKNKTYQNMNEYLTTDEVGKKVRSNSQKTGKYYGKDKNQRQPIYKANANIEGTPIQEGWHFYFDYTHYDHLEVFDDKGRFECAMTLDGFIHEIKTQRGKGRTIKDELK